MDAREKCNSARKFDAKKMDRLRTPFLILAIILMFLAVLIEAGTALPGVLRGIPAPVTTYQLPPSVASTVTTLNSDQQKVVAQLSKQERPPGLSIPDLALLDSIMLFSLLLIGLALFIPQRLQGKVQGMATLLFALLLIGFSLRQVLAAVSALILMLALFLSIPFGTIIYLIIYGSFNRAGADIVLSISMLLKVGFAISLVLAQQRFLQSKGLVLLALTSLLGVVLVSLLLGIVPAIFVSITDAIGAILIGIIAIICGVFLLVGAIVSLIKSSRLDR